MLCYFELKREQNNNAHIWLNFSKLSVNRIATSTLPLGFCKIFEFSKINEIVLYVEAYLNNINPTINIYE